MLLGLGSSLHTRWVVYSRFLTEINFESIRDGIRAGNKTAARKLRKTLEDGIGRETKGCDVKGFLGGKL